MNYFQFILNLFFIGSFVSIIRLLKEVKKLQYLKLYRQYN